MRLLRGGPERIRERKEDLQDKGILKREPVFGNILNDVPLWNDPQNPDEHELPQFVVRCIKKVETLGATVGIYRINGDAAIVQTIR